MTIFKSLLILAVCFATVAKAQEKFEVIGTTGTQLEGKKIYISNHYTEYSKRENAVVDSVTIKNGQFYFTGSLKNPATLISLYIERPGIGLKQFFIENRKINVKIANTTKTNLLSDCLLENAPVAEQQKELDNAKAGYMSKFAAFSQKEQKEYATANNSLKSAMQNEYRLLAKEETTIESDFIKKHPGYYVSLFWFSYRVTDRIINQPDSALALFKQLDPKLQQLPEGQAVLQRITNKLGLSQNKTLPEFSIPDTSGTLITSASFKNKYLLIDFWASWCGPCIEDIPNVKKVHAQFGNKTLALLSVSLDDKKDYWLRAVKKYALPWTQVSELKGWEGLFPKKMDIRYIPQYYLVDPQGKFVLMGASIEKVQQYLQEIN
ncbi:MAG: TlpA disulfide reductase family protein [Sediminibacterium sp.]